MTKYSIIELIRLGQCVGAGMAAVGVAGSGVGIGIIFGSLLEAYAHPSLEKKLFSYAIFGFALTEAIALFALMISFLILFSFKKINDNV